MEGTIAILDPQLINQIAAGEVVERPSSIVKELIENALDAQATSIEIHLEQGGLEAICVTDNGIGMSRQDAPLALQRYATSKLRHVEQLQHLKTWGFRGEALAAIASVSQTTLSTKRAEDAYGTQIQVIDGQTQPIRSVGMVTGTSLLIEHLFAQVPARKKFLRSSGTEASYVLDIVSRMAVIAPHVGWRLTHGKRTLLHLPQHMTAWEERFSVILRRPVVRYSGCRQHKEDPPVQVEFQWVVGRTRALERTKLWLFVNGRIIKDYQLARFILGLMGQHAMPQAGLLCVVMQVPFDLVDVNVHPQKLEVRFATTETMLPLLQQGIEALVQSYLGEQTGSTLAFPAPSKLMAPSSGVWPSDTTSQASSSSSLEDNLSPPVAPRPCVMSYHASMEKGTSGQVSKTPTLPSRSARGVEEDTQRGYRAPIQRTGILTGGQFDQATSLLDQPVSKHHLQWVCSLPGPFWIARCLDHMWLMDWSMCCQHILTQQGGAHWHQTLLLPQKFIIPAQHQVPGCSWGLPCWQTLPWKATSLLDGTWLCTAAPWPWHGLNVQELLQQAPWTSDDRQIWMMFWLKHLPSPSAGTSLLLPEEDDFLQQLQQAIDQPTAYLQPITHQRLQQWSQQDGPRSGEDWLGQG